MRTRSKLLLLAVVLAQIVTLTPSGAGASVPARTPTAGRDFAAGEVLVRFQREPRERSYELPDGVGVQEAASTLEHNPRVAWAVPNYVAHAAGSWVPNDPGSSSQPGGWRKIQWNFVRPSRGVRATAAWTNLIADRRPGGQGVKVAVLDTGISSAADNPSFPISPDFTPEQFAPGHDFVSGDSDPSDQNGHGTHVAGTIGEQVDNGVGATGLAYGATLIPVRVLNRKGKGKSDKVASGIHWAADQGAQVINMSLDFKDLVSKCDQIPAVCEAIDYATSKGALVVAAAGNDAMGRVAYPARAPGALAVGASTDDGCLASYSDFGEGLDLVAPGGGGSAALSKGRRCKTAKKGREICQMSFLRPMYSDFAIRCMHGTSQATPHVSAAAALVIASGVLGKSPDPAALADRLTDTAHKLGARVYYGAGLLDAGAATSN